MQTLEILISPNVALVRRNNGVQFSSCRPASRSKQRCPSTPISPGSLQATPTFPARTSPVLGKSWFVTVSMSHSFRLVSLPVGHEAQRMSTPSCVLCPKCASVYTMPPFLPSWRHTTWGEKGGQAQVDCIAAGRQLTQGSNSGWALAFCTAHAQRNDDRAAGSNTTCSMKHQCSRHTFAKLSLMPSSVALTVPQKPPICTSSRPSALLLPFTRRTAVTAAGFVRSHRKRLSGTFRKSHGEVAEED